MRMIFVNLPVSDLDRSKTFFSALGFGFNAKFTDHTAACMVVEENISVMLLTRERFADFITGEIADPARGTEVLTCLSADSREQVSEMKARALAAGGRDWKPDVELGFMFGVSFQDPDGHVWEVMWMDPAAAAGGPPDMAG